MSLTNSTVDPAISRMTLIYEDDSYCEIVLTNGRVLSVPMIDMPTSEVGGIWMTSFSPIRRIVQVIFSRSEAIAFNLPDAEGKSDLGGRPSVYLDQNHWSTLTKALHMPERVNSTSELKAARELIELLMYGRVVAPLSSAHLVETSQLRDPLRRSHGLLVGALTAGWQLRHPLAVRQRELLTCLTRYYGHQCLLPQDVLSLDGSSVFAPVIDSMRFPFMSDVPLRQQLDLICIRSAETIASILATDEADPRDRTSSWAQGMANFACWLKESGKSKPQKREAINAYLLRDVSSEIVGATARTGMSTAELADFLSRRLRSADWSGMPALGRFREALRDRLLNSGQAWAANDLVDILYLSCAAGYCDFVVGVRSATATLRQVQGRMGVGAVLFVRLEELMEHLLPLA